MTRLSLLVALALLSLVAVTQESSAAAVSSSRSLKILLRQPTTPANAPPPRPAPGNPVTNAVSAVTATVKGIFASLAAQLKPVLDGLKLGKLDNKPTGDNSFAAQLAATNIKGLDKDTAKGTQYWTALAAKVGSAGEAGAYVQSALANLKAGGPQAGSETDTPTVVTAAGGRASSAAPAAASSASPSVVAASRGTPLPARARPDAAPRAALVEEEEASTPTTTVRVDGAAVPPPPSQPPTPVTAPPPPPPPPPPPKPTPTPTPNPTPAPPPPPPPPPPAPGGAFTDYHVVVRAFIPGANTAAIAGVNTKKMTIGLGNTFPANYKLAPATDTFAGYVIGIYEIDEVFNTNNRDWSTDAKANAESKTFVYVQLNKEAGAWKKKSVTNGGSTTHHFCNGVSWWPVNLWSTGLCCNDKVKWDAEEGFSDFKVNGDKVSFKINVRKGNPCVPGSYYAGPIMHNFDVEIDFAAKKFTYSGKKSQFPALEVCHGTKPTGFSCHVYDVNGKSVFDLMGRQQVVPQQTMDLYQSA